MKRTIKVEPKKKEMSLKEKKEFISKNILILKTMIDQAYSEQYIQERFDQLGDKEKLEISIDELLLETTSFIDRLFRICASLYGGK